MVECSNQLLWTILLGRSAIVDRDEILKQLKSKSDHLLKGLAYYKKPSPAAEKKLKTSKDIRQKRLEFVFAISKHLDLDQEQSLQLLQMFLIDAYRGSWKEIGSKIGNEFERHSLLQQIQSYYFSERLYALRCLKHLLGYWQDPNHPYREVYSNFLESAGDMVVKELWCQYKEYSRSEVPSSAQQSLETESQWTIQNLKEQCELLESILLYYKDYIMHVPELLEITKLFHERGFGQNQVTRANIFPESKPILNHLSFLCSMILVEGMDLELLYTSHGKPQEYKEHFILKDFSSGGTKGRQLEGLLCTWSESSYQAPVLLTWALLKYLPYREGEEVEDESWKALGDRALNMDVFGYLLASLKDPFCSVERPVASVCKVISLHLMSLAVETFSEESLGNSEVLLAIESEAFTHPRLMLEFWREDESGARLLLNSAISRFPMQLKQTLTTLLPLAADPSSVHEVYRLLASVPFYTETATEQSLKNCTDYGEGDNLLVLTKPRVLYLEDAKRLGSRPLVIPEGTVAQVSGDLVRWQHPFSAWEWFTLMCASLLNMGGGANDPSFTSSIEDATVAARLVAQILKHDFATFITEFQPLVSLYHSVLQRFYALPSPPADFIAACLECIAVTTRPENQGRKAWTLLARTGFTPYLLSSVSSVESVSVAPGHYGQLLNVWERPRGVYPITTAMLDLLLTIVEGKGEEVQDGEEAGGDQLACVVFALREVFTCCHKWRYRLTEDRDKMCCKLLQLCHKLLTFSESSKSKLVLLVTHFLLHSGGVKAVLSRLCVGVDTINELTSLDYSTVQSTCVVETLKLAFQVIDLALQHKKDQSNTPLEKALATFSGSLTSAGTGKESIHIVTTIASYCYHHVDPDIPTWATNLLKRLAQVVPMSLFACLGQDAVPIRDAYVRRLSSSVEDIELKVAILELVTKSVDSQPGLLDLFLNVRASDRSKPGEADYVLDQESCLHSILRLFDPDKQVPHSTPRLQYTAVTLLAALWKVRHDAALCAVRAQKSFWRSLTKKLFSRVRVDASEKSKAESSAYELDICSQLMQIVAMEMYYVVSDKVDKDLIDVLKDFSKADGYRTWTKHLESLVTTDSSGLTTKPLPLSPVLVEAQLNLARGWKSMLVVGSMDHLDSVFQLSSSNVNTRMDILDGLLRALESQVKAGTEHPKSLAIATELSALYLILVKKWSSFKEDTVNRLGRILQLIGQFSFVPTVQLQSHMYSSLLLLIRTARQKEDHLEPRFLLSLIRQVDVCLQDHYQNIQTAAKNKPETLAVYLMAEMVPCVSENSQWLSTLKQHSLLMKKMIRSLDEHLKMGTDEEFVEAVLSFFLAASAANTGAAKALLVNGIAQVMSASLCKALDVMLYTGVQQSRQASEWGRIWQLALKLSATLLNTLGHAYVQFALDFVGVYDGKLLKALDVLHCVRDLGSLSETRAVCHLVFQLSHYKSQWQFALPAQHRELLRAVIQLSGSCVAVLSKRATLKRAVKTMYASGLLPPEQGLPGDRKASKVVIVATGGVECEDDDAWVTTTAAYQELHNGLISILTLCLATLRLYSPCLEDLLLDGKVDLAEYPPLYALTFIPPSVDYATPSSLATLTVCLSTGLAMIKMDPGCKVGTPSRSPVKSPPPASSRDLASVQKRAEVLCLLEHAIIVLLSQATRYLVDPSVDPHAKQILKKELANELEHFCQELILSLTRKAGVPSPGSSNILKTPSAGLLHESRSGALLAEQRIFKLAELFAKQFLK
ncbi:hypothetical protein EMCRGX_G019637 [Ephydatia muelleri]